MTEQTFDYKVAGLDESGNIIVLVDDKQYGEYTFALEISESDNEKEMAKVEYEFASNKNVPIDRQEEVLGKIVGDMYEEIINSESTGTSVIEEEFTA